MALTTNKTIYLNGASKDGEKILYNFNSSLNGNITINETRLTEDSSDIEEADFKEFRELAKSTAEEDK